MNTEEGITEILKIIEYYVKNNNLEQFESFDELE